MFATSKNVVTFLKIIIALETAEKTFFYSSALKLDGIELFDDCDRHVIDNFPSRHESVKNKAKCLSLP